MDERIEQLLKENQQAANKPFVHIADVKLIIEELERTYLSNIEQILNLSNHCIPPYAFGDNEAACAMDNALNNIQQIAWDILNENKNSNRLDGIVSNANGGQCIWKSRLIYNPDCDTNIKVYNTKCNNEFTIGDGLPSDMNFNYCPYCSKKINAIETEE